MEISAAIQDLGFSRNEAKVYAALIRLGSSKAGRVSKEAQIDRTSTYNSLKLLIEKGLVSSVLKGKVTWFQPTHPLQFLAILKDKEAAIKRIMPRLLADYKERKYDENVKLFKGYAGVQAVLADIIQEGKPNLIFGSEGQLELRMPHFHKKFIREIKKKGIPIKSLVRKGRKDPHSPVANVKRVPRTVRSNVVTNIYGNKISLVIFSATPEAILIENKTAADAYRSYFEYLWSKAEK